MNIYSSYRCRTCGKEFVLLTEDAEAQEKLNRYLVCPFCSSKRVSKENATDSLRECMQERSYKRNKRGALEQR